MPAMSAIRFRPGRAGVGTVDDPYAVTVAMECLRGLAALWVFLFHIDDLVRASMPSLYWLASRGHYGVPVFFAVSGYCIFAAAQRCLRQGSGARQFLKRRLIRIFPTFWASVVVVLLPYAMEGIAALKSGSFAWPAPRWMAYSLPDWLAVLSLTKELVDTASGGGEGYTLVNSVYWTLAIEVQFYLVLYAAIVLRRRWKPFLVLVSLASFAAIAASAFAWPGFFLHHWPAFLFGVLLRLAYARGLHPAAAFGRRELAYSLLVVLALAGLLALRLALPHEVSFLESALLAALVLWALGGIENGGRAALARQARARPIAQRLLLPFVLLGQCSYSLYLLHGKLYQLPGMVVRQALPLSHPLHLVLVVLGTVAPCYAFYYFVERRYQVPATKPVPVVAMADLGLAPAGDAGAAGLAEEDTLPGI